jgi:glutaredoxin-like protein
MSDGPSGAVGADGPVPPLPDGLAGTSPVTVLWRPGCPFCAMLLRGLDRTGLAYDRVDLWEHPEASAWVRTVTGGDETVPTVRVGPTGGGPLGAVALVNPSAADVLDAVGRIAPHGLPPAPGPGQARRGLLGRLWPGRAR